MGVAGSLLTNSARDSLMYKPQCLRLEGCGEQPPHHPWAPVAQSGMAVLADYYIKEATFLANDPPSVLNSENAHFNIIW